MLQRPRNGHGEENCQHRWFRKLVREAERHFICLFHVFFQMTLCFEYSSFFRQFAFQETKKKLSKFHEPAFPGIPFNDIIKQIKKNHSKNIQLCIACKCPSSVLTLMSKRFHYAIIIKLAKVQAGSAQSPDFKSYIAWKSYIA